MWKRFGNYKVLGPKEQWWPLLRQKKRMGLLAFPEMKASLPPPSLGSLRCFGLPWLNNQTSSCSPDRRTPAAVSSSPGLPEPLHHCPQHKRKVLKIYFQALWLGDDSSGFSQLNTIFIHIYQAPKWGCLFQEDFLPGFLSPPHLCFGQGLVVFRHLGVGF